MTPSFNHSNATIWKINDTTLRDGEQMPGVFFSEDNKIEICEQLLSIGINDIEVGCAPLLNKDTKFVQYLSHHPEKERFSVWCRATQSDVEDALRLGFNKIHVSIPVSDFQLGHMDKSRTWAMKTTQQLISFLRRHVPFISVGAQDATRSDFDFLINFLDILDFFKVKRFRFSDTVGIAMPGHIAAMSTRLRNHFNGDIEFHGHNDLGLATANCIAALQHGSTEVSTTISGIGERAGNASLEQVACAIQYGLHNQTDILLSELQPICEYVSQCARVPISPNQPITGKLAFSHESGVHYSGQLKHPLMYQPFDAEDVGRESELVLGRHSGSSAICDVLQKKGIPISRQYARTLIKQLQRLYPQKGTYELNDLLHTLSVYSHTQAN